MDNVGNSQGETIRPAEGVPFEGCEHIHQSSRRWGDGKIHRRLEILEGTLLHARFGTDDSYFGMIHFLSKLPRKGDARGADAKERLWIADTEGREA